MKDLYSFDATQQEAFETYDQVANAYQRIFQRMGVPFVVAEADSGNIGGSKSHEYHLISSVGEDTLLTCHQCGYTANEELAIGQFNPSSTESTQNSVVKSMLGLDQVDATVVSFSALNAAEDNQHQGMAAILTPPGRAANLLKVQTKLSNYLKEHQWMSQRGTMDMHTIPSSALHPSLMNHLHVFMDNALSCTIETSKNLTVHTPDHFRLAKEGDLCASCDHHPPLSSVKAIECGHTFYLGTKYSAALDCTFRENNTVLPTEMGCYGIGISRLLAAVAEAKHDDKGIAWPESIAPYRVCIVPTDDRKQEFKQLADQVYDALQTHNKDNVVIDDRRSGFGAKMKDAELVGYPYTIIIGPKTLEHGQVEVHQRMQGQQSKKTVISLDSVLKSGL
ncbi:uncharacterized protein B0P05DRAFT_471383 [Gilbertella persicaria]|nr:uncharacterized protein B0P05DRAFT_471383 [Gilbertella persicaria]KAI8077378.1 hypothetical protein B0P05DRAFT_471383 [Gilbertella persicaria]